MTHTPALPNCLYRIGGTYYCAFLVTAYSNGTSWIEGLNGVRSIVSSSMVSDLRGLPEQQVKAACMFQYAKYI